MNSGWLYDHLQEVLNPLGFIIDTQAKIVKSTAPTNEYVNSHLFTMREIF